MKVAHFYIKKYRINLKHLKKYQHCQTLHSAHFNLLDSANTVWSGQKINKIQLKKQIQSTNIFFAPQVVNVPWRLQLALVLYGAVGKLVQVEAMFSELTLSSAFVKILARKLTLKVNKFLLYIQHIDVKIPTYNNAKANADKCFNILHLLKYITKLINVKEFNRLFLEGENTITH